jgi:glyoxylase-like metal-dependent hydrolase (beta-lactamase superfamily II)
VCEDARQYLPETGQAWLTPEELARDHATVVRDDAGFTGIGVEPRFAIGQRALLVPFAGRSLLWDCVPLLDDAAVAAVEERGGLAAIAISHPHFYSAMVEWAHRFGCPVLLHAADAGWIMRPDPAIELWDGDARELGEGLTLVRCGGHFAGATVLHDARAGALLSGDTVQVIPDRAHVGFMYSYPNLIPLPVETVRAIAARLAPYRFETIHGGWWGTVVRRDGSAAVTRSAERYARAVGGELP